MTKAIYTATSEYIDEVAALPAKHHVSVSGVLHILGVSRSGYLSWKKRKPSNSEQHRNHIKEKIKEIYDNSHQNYGAPKITQELHKQGETTAEKTVGNYMRQMGLKAQWVKPYTVTTINSDFGTKLKNILDEKFNPAEPDAVWVSDITYIWTFEGFVYNEFIGFNPDDPLAKLNEEGKEKALEYIGLLLLSEQFQKQEATIIPFRRPIKWSTLAASAGTGEFPDDENFEIIEVGEEVPEEADFGLALNGDSMEPRYHDNQAVWVQQTNSLNNGEIGIFYLDGMTYCKQLKDDKDGVYLISLNSKYDSIKVTDESSFKIFGRVLN